MLYINRNCMKRIALLFWVLLFALAGFAQGGVNFEPLTFEQALDKAKKEGKMVFVDCYTSWCGPCKYMAENVFTLKEAGDYFNPRFVSVKFDMEKGEGLTLAKKWPVSAYPTFFLIKPDGTIQHKIVGGGTLQAFVARVEKGLEKKTSLDYLQNRYAKGKIDKKEMMDYISALTDAHDYEAIKPVREQLETRLTDKDRVKAEFWPLLADKEYRDEEDFRFILEHLPILRKNVGENVINAYLYDRFSVPISQCKAGRGPEAVRLLEKIRGEIAASGMENNERLVKYWELADASAREDIERTLALVEEMAPLAKTNNEIWPVLSPLFDWVKGKASKEQLKRIAVFLGDLAEAQTDERLSGQLHNSAETFRRLSFSGICFQDISFEEAKAKAREEGLMLFIDCYTGWCGPCMYMANVIFKEEELGDFMNERFVCVKYDMESEKGSEVQKTYGVQVYPTFIILNPDGSLRHQFVGGGDAGQFLSRVKEALNDSTALAVQMDKYKKGCRDTEFLKRYVQALMGIYSPDAAEAANELFMRLTDEERLSPDYWFIAGDVNIAPGGTEIADYVLRNRESYNKVMGKQKVDDRLLNGYMKDVMMILLGKLEIGQMPEVDFKQVSRDVAALGLKNNKTCQAYIKMAEAKKSGDIDYLISTCEKVFSKDLSPRVIYNMGGVGANATQAQRDRWNSFLRRVGAETGK